MINIFQMKSLKLYKMPVTLYDDKAEDINSGHYILLTEPDIQGNVNMLETLNDKTNFITKPYRGYFMSNRYHFKLNYITFKEVRRPKDIFNEYIRDNKNIRKLTLIQPTLNDYKYNSYIDISYYFNAFRDIPDKGNINKRISIFKSMLDIAMNDIGLKEGSKLILPIDMSKVKNYDDTDSIFGLIYIDLFKDFNILKGIDMELLCFNKSLKFKFNLKDLYEENSNFNLLRSLYNKTIITGDTNIDIIPEIEEGSKEDIKTIVSNKITDVIASNLKNTFTGDKSEISDGDRKVIDKAISDTVDILPDNIKVEDIKEDDPLIKDAIEKVVNSRSEVKSSSSTLRDAKLREEQAKLIINNKPITDIYEQARISEVEIKKMPITTINKDMVEYSNRNTDYNTKVRDRDIISIVDSFKDKEVKIFIRSCTKEDTSDEFNKKETWTFELEDEYRRRHTLKFDMPLFIDDKFLYIGGNKKNIVSQLLLLPVVKTGPDTVQLCSFYNKIFLTRFGMKISPRVEKFIKAISNLKNSKIKIDKGNNILNNKSYKTTIEFDGLAENFNSITFNGDLIINFNINDNIIKYEQDGRYSDIDRYIPIGIYKKNTLYLDVKDEIVIYGDYKDTNIIDFIINMINSIDKDFDNVYNSISVGKKYMYTRATIMAKNIPLILLLSYCEGLSTVLSKGKINYRFSEKNISINTNIEGKIKFSDGYLIYDKYPFANSLLMNGLYDIDTSQYSFIDMDDRMTYSDIFFDLVGTRSIINAFSNFYNLFIDSVTLGVLETEKLPTDFVSLLIYANRLLEDNDYTEENAMSNWRLRNSEILTAIAYKKIASAFEKYNNTANNRNPQKISIPQDAIIKDIMSSTIIEDYSTLNPTLEMERLSAVSFRGPNGLNLEQAYTIEKRSFHPSMLGVVALSSPPTGSVGVTRYLTVNPTVTSTRGYITNKPQSELNQSNVFMTSELVAATSSTRDDSQRIAMNTAQSKHVVPVTKGDPVLMGNGMDKSIAYLLSNDFVYKAKEDGTIVEKNDKLMILKYKSGEIDVVDLSDKVDKNSSGGYYISNKLNTDLKLGSKFKKDEIVALNNKFFANKDMHGDTSFKLGSLQKIAIVNDSRTYEDSTAITRKVARDMGTEVVMMKNVVLDKNISIEKIASIGDKINAGEPLIIYEEGFDQDISAVLSGMRSDLQDKILDLGKNSIKSKYTGVIQDIKIYYNCDFEELNSSVKSIINKYKKRDKEYINLISKYDKSKIYDVTVSEYSRTVSSDNRIKGTKVDDGVMIEFYIKFIDEMKIGDKQTMGGVALKGIVCEVFPEGKEPISEFRPDEEVGAILGTRSVLARMTCSVFVNMFANKVLLELGNAVGDILDENEDFYKRIDMKNLTEKR